MNDERRTSLLLSIVYRSSLRELQFFSCSGSTWLANELYIHARICPAKKPWWRPCTCVAFPGACVPLVRLIDGSTVAGLLGEPWVVEPHRLSERLASSTLPLEEMPLEVSQYISKRSIIIIETNPDFFSTGLTTPSAPLLPPTSSTVYFIGHDFGFGGQLLGLLIEPLRPKYP